MKIIPNILTYLFISMIFIQCLMAKQTITGDSTNFSSANDNFGLIEKNKTSNMGWINFITQNEKQKLESGIYLLDSIINYEYISVNDSVKKQKTIIEYDIPEKKTTTLYLRWERDKMEWLKDGKIVETLNDDGNILSSERFLWDIIEQKWKSGLWYWSGHTRNKYNQNGQLAESIEYYDDKDIEGSIFNKTTWGYDDNSREILYLNYSITNNDSILKLSTEKSTLYEDNGMKKVIMYKNWDYELHAIVNSTKNITILDSSGNEVEFEYYVWDSHKDDWIVKSKTTKQYNSENKAIELLDKEWDPLKNKWINDQKKEFEYNQLGEKILTNEYFWQSVSEEWYLIEAYKIEKKKADFLDFDVMETSYYKHNSDSDFIPHFRDYRRFDSEGRETALENYKWNNIENIWEYGRKHETTFDDYNNTTTTQNYRDKDKTTWELSWTSFKKYDNQENLLISKSFNNDQDKNFGSGYGTYYFFSEKQTTSSSNKNHNPGLDFNIYPNPSNGMVYFEGFEDIWVSVFVYNIEGKKIWETNGFGINKINLTGFKKGLYLIQVNTENDIYSTRLILK